MTAHTLRSLAGERDPRELAELCARWGRTADAKPAPGPEPDLPWLSLRMGELEVVRTKVAALSGPHAELLQHFVAAPGAMRTRTEIEAGLLGSGTTNGSAARPMPRLARFGLEAALATLLREGFLWPARSRAWQDLDARGFAIPAELHQSLMRLVAGDSPRLEERLSLQGWLEARFFRAEQGKSSALDDAERARQADHARKIYKLYLLPQSIEGRVKALPPGSRALFRSTLVDHGGFLPVAECAASDGAPFDTDLHRRALEEVLVGTIAPLPLERVGVQPVESVVLFHEVVLHGLQAHSERHPVQVEETLSCGIDLLTNLSRFLRELEVGEVQFTSEGKLYKASEKRIAKGLIALPGPFLEPEPMTAWLYKFCVQRRLVDRRGARALGITEQGHAFEKLTLAKKVESLLGFAIEERDLAGEPFHQVRLRRYFLDRKSVV